MIEGQQQQASDIRHYIVPIWRRRYMIIAIVVALTGVTYYYYGHKPKQYQASARVYISPSQVQQSLLGVALEAANADRNMLNEATLLTTPETAKAVAALIGYQGNPSDLLNGISSTPETGKDFLDITAVASSSARAAQMANAFADSFIATSSAKETQNVTGALRADQLELRRTPRTLANSGTRDQLSQEIRHLEAVASLPSGTATLAYAATPPGIPFAPKPLKNAIYGFVLAVMLAATLAYNLERFDRRITRLEDVEIDFGQPLLTVLPHAGEANPLSEDSMASVNPIFRESFRGLRANLELATLADGMRSLLVLSALPGEGKSTIVRNLALTYAEGGQRVCIIESDGRKPTQAKLNGIPDEPGLTHVLAGTERLDAALHEVAIERDRPQMAEEASGTNGAQNGEGIPPTTNGGSTRQATRSLRAVLRGSGSVTVLPSGPALPNPPALLASERMAEVVEELTARFDLVIIDTAPLLVVSDALPLMGRVDRTLVVTRMGVITHDAVKRLVDISSRVPGANFVGLVANDVPTSELVEGGKYPYYQYGQYGEYSSQQQTPAAEGLPSA